MKIDKNICNEGGGATKRINSPCDVLDCFAVSWILFCLLAASFNANPGMIKEKVTSILLRHLVIDLTTPNRIVRAKGWPFIWYQSIVIWCIKWFYLRRLISIVVAKEKYG